MKMQLTAEELEELRRIQRNVSGSRSTHGWIEKDGEFEQPTVSGSDRLNNIADYRRELETLLTLNFRLCDSQSIPL